MFYGSSPSSLSPLVPRLLTKNCVLIWFYGLCAHCCLMLHSYGVWSGAALDWPRSTWRVRNIKYTQTNTPDPLPRWLPYPVPSPALPYGAGIYLVMGFSGNSFQLFDLLLVPHAPPPPPRSSHAYHHSNLKHCQFSNSPRLPIPPPLSIVCQAWKCIHRIIHHNFVCRVDLQAFKLWEDRRENGLIMENCEIDRSCVDSWNRRHSPSLFPIKEGI